MPLELPDFPWDLLTPYGDEARTHPDGIVDLSVGSPVDPTPASVREALSAATDAHAYPLTAGSPALRSRSSTAIGRPVTRRTDSITSSTVKPCPLPML